MKRNTHRTLHIYSTVWFLLNVFLFTLDHNNIIDIKVERRALPFVFFGTITPFFYFTWVWLGSNLLKTTGAHRTEKGIRMRFSLWMRLWTIDEDLDEYDRRHGLTPKDYRR